MMVIGLRSGFARLLVLLPLTLGAIMAVTASAALAAGKPSSSTPAGGVYTCDWIASHPAAAAQARVTCDLATFIAATSSEPGAVGTASGLSQPLTPDANGCQSVPNGGGRVGKGVFAWSQYEYANDWGWNALYSPAYYTFYIQRTDGSSADYGPRYDTYWWSSIVPANNYHWGAQNHNDTPQSWWVCYDVV